MAENGESDIRYYIPRVHLPATIIAFRTSENATQSQGDALVEYEYSEEVKGFVDEGEISIFVRRAELRATKDGIVGKIHVAKGDVIDDESKVILDYQGCDHDSVYEGMCVVCCKSVEVTTRSHVNMTHDAMSLAVSRPEAKRLEQGNAERLLEEGKLSLIVDLDQTLIHATVGTAIDEWINAQGEMPKDIKMFPLPDSPTPYYIKLRPHLEAFLKKVTKLYELHIYTMGTRNYAAAVANVIDPDSKFFSQRILSRDENSSMTQKSIERLFPCDNSMVVVIDDRADVWQYSPNLVKVHPYEYFVGAGDINAGHLPKQVGPVTTEIVNVPESTVPESKDSEVKEGTSSITEASAAATSTKDTAATTSLDVSTGAESGVTTAIDAGKTDSEKLKNNKALKAKAPVLDDNDNELRHILEILETIHEKFYDAKENFKQRQSRKDADVKTIIHDMKRHVLRGVNIVFSGVIPLGEAPERADIWRQAQAFGAECSRDLNSRVTHVVAAKPGTDKVTKARHRKNIKVVRPEWLYHSIGKWQRQDEFKYLLPDKAGKATPVTSTTPPPTTEGEEGEGTGVEDGEDQGNVSEGMDENHQPMSMDKDEITEHLKSVNWDDMEKEVEEFVGDMDDTDADSDASNTQSDASTDGNRSPLLGLKRTRLPRRSGLGKSVTFASGDDEDNDSVPSDLDMGGLEDDEVENAGISSDEGDGDIDEESGSDDDDDDDEGRPSRKLKRRRIDIQNGDAAYLAEEEEEDVDADDEITMEHLPAKAKTANIAAEEEVVEEDDGDFEGEEDDDFFRELENDLDAQLNEDFDNDEE
ncbi:Carboxy-terminal domain (CTD) phosphatase [Mortierella sp. GBA30]|nr:Carboxy-terminal domain (CTD) phosphatase [Mortierella sp. GBA30]